MTDRVSELEVLLADVREYINDKQQTIDRLLTKALEANEIDEVSYRRLSAEICESENWNEVFKHFAYVSCQILDAGYNHLLGRIVSGAEFISSLEPGDKRLEAAERKYEALISQKDRLRKWLNEHDAKEIQL